MKGSHQRLVEVKLPREQKGKEQLLYQHGQVLKTIREWYTEYMVYVWCRKNTDSDCLWWGQVYRGVRSAPELM